MKNEELKEELTDQDAEKGSERLMIVRKIKGTQENNADRTIDKTMLLDQTYDVQSIVESSPVVNVKSRKKNDRKKVET